MHVTLSEAKSLQPLGYGFLYNNEYVSLSRICVAPFVHLDWIRFGLIVEVFRDETVFVACGERRTGTLLVLTARTVREAFFAPLNVLTPYARMRLSMSCGWTHHFKKNLVPFNSERILKYYICH